MIEKIVIENLLIIVGESFFVFSSFSQLRKLITTRNPRGLFAPTTALNAAGNIAWIMYFISQNLWVPIITNAVMFVLTVSVLGLLLSNKKQFAKGLISIAVLGPLTALIIIKFPDFSGWTGMIFNTIASTPWLIHVVTTKRVSGLSERSIYLSTGAMLCVLAYGSMMGAVPLIAGCIQGLLYMVIIASHYYYYRNNDQALAKKV
jgi:uncharacterized protein with PQ loop repeat